MIVFVLKRLVSALLSLGLVILLTFIFLRLLPGGPFDSEVALAPELKAALETRYGLTAPVFKQFITYISGLASGDFGESLKFADLRVNDLIASGILPTFTLGGLALLLALGLGTTLGLISAHRVPGWGDRLLQSVAAVLMSLPAFLVGPCLVLVFSFWIDIFPPGLWESPRYFVLPAITLALRPLALVMRLVRSQAVEVLQSDFVRTARAKGVGEVRLLLTHVLRNSWLPLLSILGPLTTNLLSGSFVVEMLFSVPGLGRHFIESVSNRDYTVALGMTVFYASILLVMTTVADILTILVDPRIELS